MAIPNDCKTTRTPSIMIVTLATLANTDEEGTLSTLEV